MSRRAAPGAPLLRVGGLVVEAATGGGAVRRIVDGLDLDLHPGEVTALVGRSGSGKTLTARSLIGLAPRGVLARGSALLDTGDGAPVDLLALSRRRLRAVRGARVGAVFQEAQAGLNPTVRVGGHFTETLAAHGVPRSERRAAGAAALARVGLVPSTGLWTAYPFELSGGQAQRVAIALATVLAPRLLIADEITSALDAVTRAEVLDLLRGQTVAAGCALLLVTHDLDVAGRWADRIAVLDGGRIVEHGRAAALLAAPAHPFTRALVGGDEGAGA
ncbi:ABC-type dipeptide/oligopeptide/nickel transport system ATPase component [Murinocardiopsis flavida]|uniref:ABC-type dipeptide/oligopeptide/nickel transport system ATPase component n=1 Tax=Murinocardiopsis flavida TaxID=645275 RepID=A0A2P8DQS9_9ACTN|nr:dipeptide/oligopeptide/nickel ABC transporter ATP-binding protein [Murinocardiopsis flavida]PSK99576.1 ABC-type dipeptide/oligopeptide/nickel transport system ATPase component [Murinocardiopsis flavida]